MLCSLTGMRARPSVITGLVAVLATLSAAACRQADTDREVREALVQVLAAAPLSPALERALGALPATSVRAVVWDDVEAFYRPRQMRPVWVNRAGPLPRAAVAIRLLGTAPEHALSVADYDHDALGRQHAELTATGTEGLPPPAQALAAFETRLTAAFLALGRDVAFGRTNPQVVDPSWRARRNPLDFPRRLSEVVDRDPAAWLDEVRPHHPEYAALQRALAGLDGGDEAAKAAINLERWRWMPDDFGATHILINIPEYHLYVRENDADVLDSRVIVGKRGNRTPVFSGTMDTVVFSPYWNIPDTIAAGETVPAVVRDPTYLARNRIDVLRRSASGVERVNPATVDWDNPEAIRDLAFRQRPGAANALGHVKFLLPNPYSVYLHDTPADELFARPGRALSHGCVRVEQALKLAQYVLRNDPEWDEARIDAAMHAGTERSVSLKALLPVHIVYFTAWAGPDGELRTVPDIYDYDARQLRAVGSR